MDPKPPSGPTSPISSQTSFKDETFNGRSSASDSTHESVYHSLSLTESPRVQVMERHDDFDISSRFSSPSSEWSSASSESLFSIRFNNSYKHDHAQLSAADAVERSSQSDVGSLSLRAESLNKLDVHMSDLDEPQKVVRWKTQVERLADEGVKSQGQQLESSPLTDHKSSEPKNKFCWSTCNCGSCDLPKWMSCSNCKPKRKRSSQPKEANSPASGAPKKPDQKLGLRNQCCYRYCSGPWSCSCHCCFGDISAV